MKTDLSYLNTMSGGSTELISEMIDIFNTQAVEFISEMQILLDKKDYEALGKLAHKAKSSVAIMGMDQLASKLKDLELKTIEGRNTEEYQSYVDLFKSDCQVAILELTEYKNKI